MLNYLSGETTPTHYSSELMSNASEYDGFNLITGSFGYSQNIHGNTFLSSLSLSPPVKVKSWFIVATGVTRRRVPLWVESMD